MNMPTVPRFILPTRVRRSRLDCSEFFLWTQGELCGPDADEEAVWENEENNEKGTDIHGYQII
jgi:hypothetical protein